MSVFRLRVPPSENGQVDREAVRRAAGILFGLGERRELRGLPSGRSRLVWADDLDALADAAAALSGGTGVYYTLNPVRPDLGDHAARVKDVLRRAWFLIDVDRVKSVEPDASATDAEKEAAQKLAMRLLDSLTAKGWPAPVVVDSGNGYHLLYRVDLPNDPIARNLLKSVLVALKLAHDTPEAEIDGKVHDAPRVAKLPGTWARKGVSTADRPHRLCKVVYRPEPLEVVTADQLQAVAGVEARPVEPTPGPSPFKLRAVAGTDTRAAYVRSAVAGELAKVALAPVNDRNNTLNAAAFNLGTLVGAGVADRLDIERDLLTVALRSGLTEHESRATIRSGLDAGTLQPRILPERPAVLNNHHAAPVPIDPSKRIIILASEITPKKVEWLWPGRVPLKKMTTFAGRGKLGKTFVLLDIAARVSVGGEIPGRDGECFEPGQVLFISGEDEPDDTLVPRLIEMGADLGRIAFLVTEALDKFTLADLPAMDAAVDQLGAGTRLVVIDPPTAYLGGVDDHNNADLRGLLSPLKSWSARRMVSLIFNTHVNKASGQSVEAMARVMGSVAWVNAVRSAHLFAPDPDDHSRRLFVPMGQNVGKEDKGLAYRIVETETLAKVEWLGTVDTTADEAMGKAKGPPRRIVASQWLVDQFRKKREWLSDDLFHAAKAEGISRDAIFEAKRILALPRAKRDVLEDGSINYVWHVPPGWQPPAIGDRRDDTTVVMEDED
jgi:putative DNA primase/helicase